MDQLSMDGVRTSGTMDGFLDDLLKAAETSITTGLQATKDAAITSIVNQPTVQASVQRATEAAVAKAEQAAVLTAYEKAKEAAAKYKYYLMAGGAALALGTAYMLFFRRKK